MNIIIPYKVIPPEDGDTFSQVTRKVARLEYNRHIDIISYCINYRNYDFRVVDQKAVGLILEIAMDLQSQRNILRFKDLSRLHMYLRSVDFQLVSSPQTYIETDMPV